MSNKEKIAEYERDIERLEKMLSIYESVESLTGQYYNDMIGEINLQLEACKTFRWNLKVYPVVDYLTACKIAPKDATLEFIGEAFPKSSTQQRKQARKIYINSLQK